MMTDAEQWEGMERVEVQAYEDTLLVTSGRARDWVPGLCPVCGQLVSQVRRVRAENGQRLYYTLHGGRLHELAVRGRARGTREVGR